MLRFDLDRPESGWQTLPGPGYETRGLSVAAHADKLYVLAGCTMISCAMFRFSIPEQCLEQRPTDGQRQRRSRLWQQRVCRRWQAVLLG